MFPPEILPLPELPPPPGVDFQTLWGIFGQHSRVIWAEGTERAPVFVVLDNPGAREDAAGASFVCGTRQTLREAARQAGLRDEDLFVTWVLKCRPRRAYDKPAARAACLPYLLAQVDQQNPRVVIALGNVALQALLGDENATVRERRGQVMQWQGHPLICGYHPLAARRRPNLFPYLAADLALAAQIAAPSGHTETRG